MAKKANSTKSFILRVDAAADEFRSINGQLQWIITDSLRRNRRLPKHRKTSDEDKEV